MINLVDFYIMYCKRINVILVFVWYSYFKLWETQILLMLLSYDSWDRLIMQMPNSLFCNWRLFGVI